MDKNLDKLFKGKLENRNFDFQDVHWQQAAKMLDARDKRRRRFALFLWTALIGLVVLLISFYILKIDKSHQKTSSPQAAVEPLKTREKQEQSSKTDITTNETGALNENVITQDNKSLSENELVPSSPGNIGNERPSQNRSFSNEEVPSSEKQNGNVTDKPIEKGYENESQSQLIEKSTNFEDSPQVSDKADVIALRSGREMEAIPFLPLETLNASPDEIAYHVPASEKVNLSLPWAKGFGWGLTASGVFSGSTGNSGSNLLGGKAGLYATWHFTFRWSVEAALQYSLLSGRFSEYSGPAGTQYGFGKTETSQTLQPDLLHYLDLPVSIQFYNRAHVVEAGLIGRRLLAAGAKKEVYEKAPLTALRRVDEQKGVLEDSEYWQKTMFGAFIGYHYQWDKASLGLRSFYFPKGILINPQENPGWPDGKLQIEMILKIHLAGVK